jgi:DNA-binding response OmpR family regulator
MTEKKKLLITERLRPLLEQDGSALARKDVEVFTASSGDEILRIHGREHMDLIMVDLKLDSTGGDAVCTAVRHDATMKKVSLIVICDNDKSQISKCQSCGANAFITNPVDQEVLIRNIIKFLYIADRKNLRIIFKVFTKGKSKDLFFFANTADISSSGILLETDHILEKSEKLTLSFFIGKEPVKLNGKIMRIAEAEGKMLHYGVQFIELNPILRRKIEEFVEKS